VLVAEDAVEALALLRRTSNQVALVLMDLSMPGMSAREAIEEIHRGWPGTPIVLSSGYDENEVLSRFQGMRLAGFVQKPYTAAQLAERVKSAMAQGAPRVPFPISADQGVSPDELKPAAA